MFSFDGILINEQDAVLPEKILRMNFRGVSHVAGVTWEGCDYQGRRYLIGGAIS